MTAAVQAGLDKVKAGLTFDLLDNDNQDIYNVQDFSGTPSQWNRKLSFFA